MTRRFFLLASLISLFLIVNAASAQTYNNADTFTYQGSLVLNGIPVNKLCDFAFQLFDAPSGGNAIGDTKILVGQPVVNGVFTVALDYSGDVFANSDRYLEIAVNCGDGTKTLSPRQPIYPAPLAMALPGLYTQANATSPNVLGGYHQNAVTNNAVGVVIAGGGRETEVNTSSADYTTISGGRNNQATAVHATIGGGRDHIASEDHATVGGGRQNTASSNFTTVAGGRENIASGEGAAIVGGRQNQATGTYATVGGGRYNTVFGAYGTIAGGGQTEGENPRNNTVFDDFGTVGGGAGNWAGANDGNTALQPFATVAGGFGNGATGDSATVGGGYSNNATGGGATVGGGFSNDATGSYATVGGGTGNEATGSYATVGGGTGNEATGSYATVGGGAVNEATGYGATVGGGSSNDATGDDATVGGGSGNDATGDGATVGGGSFNDATGVYATVPGGRSNRADGDFSFAAGWQARATGNNTFVWSDGTADPDLANFTGDRKFNVIATEGVQLFVSSDLQSNAKLFPNSNSWSFGSDLHNKEAITPVDTEFVLAAIGDLPISTWEYKNQDGVLHMGPMSQDFHVAFGLGVDDKHIDTVDGVGVALAASKGLYEQNQTQAQQIADLTTRIAALERQLLLKESGMNIMAFVLVALGGYWFARRQEGTKHVY